MADRAVATGQTTRGAKLLSDDQRMADLDARLQALKAGLEDDEPHVEDHYTQAHAGWRMVIELVVGLLFGFGIGYGQDRQFGTLPIFLVLFTMLGLAAGVRVMMQTARELQKEHVSETSDNKDKGA